MPLAMQAEYGKRLVPHVIDERAREYPQRQCLQVPRSSQPIDGWKPVTFKNFANAINRCCHMINERCGKAPDGAFPTLAYIGPNDFRYLMFMVAAIKTGYKAFFISPRNSEEGQLHLLRETSCQFLAFPDSHKAIVQPWLAKSNIQPVEIAPQEAWLDDEDVQDYPYTKTFDQARWDPLVVLHTSGSTGLPKPIVCRQGAMAIADSFHELPEWQGSKIVYRFWSEHSEGIFSPMPLFHAAAVYVFVMMTIYWDTPMILGIPDRPLTSELVIECLNNSSAKAAMLPPAILEDMSLDQNSTNTLAKLGFAAYGGGSLAPSAGNRLVSNGVRLSNVIASTETAPFPLYMNPAMDTWQYFMINTDVLGCQWRKLDGEEDVFEQVIVRKAEEPGSQAVFYTFPDAREYSTKDLFKPHPTLANLWMHIGRADDIIVFSNGEKLNPVSIEKTVTGHPQVRGALVVGSNRFQAALIIEPLSLPDNGVEEKELLDSIWPFVAKANELTVQHGRIDRNLLVLSDPARPFLRAAKGTIQRAATVKLYHDYIDATYRKIERVEPKQIIRLNLNSEASLADSIRTMFAVHLGSAELGDETDFFSIGVDSLQIIQASRLLRSALEAQGHRAASKSVAPGIINSNPTPTKLARHIIQTIVRGTNGNNVIQPDPDQEAIISALHQKYTQNLHMREQGRPNALDNDQTVVLTGSTGMLGSYMLDFMCRSPAVKRVICFNRAKDGGLSQQIKSMEERGLDQSYREKAEFHHVDASQDYLGLTQELYARLLRETDRIVLNAWPVNFNMPISSFEPHLSGIRNFANLAAKADKRVAIIFVSSIATVTRWDPRRGPVPEETLDDLSLADGGYGCSKLLGSLILQDAARMGDFPTVSIRVGQITGPKADAGVWNRQEWFPSLVASSLYLKALPADLGAMKLLDWIPAEDVASLILEAGGIIQKVETETISGYYHGINPSTTTWDCLALAIQEFYGEERLPEMISFNDWVDRLEKSSEDDLNTAVINPGAKLLDSYRGMAASESIACDSVTLDTKRTLGQCPTLRACRAITPELMKQWCKHWDFVLA